MLAFFSSFFVFFYFFFIFRPIALMAFFFRLDQPIRRILYSDIKGATALAICFPRQHGDINPYQLRQTKAVCERADNQF